MSNLNLVTVELPVVRCKVCSEPYVIEYAFSGLSMEPGYVYRKKCRHKLDAADGAEPIEWSSFGVARISEPEETPSE